MLGGCKTRVCACMSVRRAPRLVLDSEGLAGEPWEGSVARLGLWAWALREGREREGRGRGGGVRDSMDVNSS